MDEQQQREAQAMHGRMSELYDVFVDWEGRLAREMPGILAHLEQAGVEKVLDAGCGTGRHVGALRWAGFDAHGADASPDMVAQARAHADDPKRIHEWRMGDAPGSSLLDAAPFDAVICMGNTWTLLHTDEDALNATLAFRKLVRPGGLVLLGLKALAVREENRNPYMPLLKREHEGRPLWFVRFVDFAIPPQEDGTRVGDFHMVIVAGDASVDESSEALLHRTSRMRVWHPTELLRWFEGRGLEEVTVSARLDDPHVPPAGEDVFLRAFLPR